MARPIDLSVYEVDSARGFLPRVDPLDHLPAALAPWEELAQDLPKLLVSDRLRDALDALPVLDSRSLTDRAQVERAMLVLSFLGQAYVFGGGQVTDRIPRGIAVPWYEVGKKLGRPPILSYASYALHNWRRMDPHGPIALGNVALLQNFLGGVDEEWFILVHVEIEARAGPALAALVNAQCAVQEGNLGEVEQNLVEIARALEWMYGTLARMPERCDPYIYYNRVRPYIHGWKDNPALPNGVVYDGVEAYKNQPQKFRGETGAQSTIVPSLDAGLGISHRDDPLRPYLMEMRDYAPPRHRAFLSAIESGPSVRDFVMKHPALVEAYNACVEGVEKFRSKHLEYAATYIQKQAPRGEANPTDVGTGGTPFMPYLKKHRDETGEQRLN